MVRRLGEKHIFIRFDRVLTQSMNDDWAGSCELLVTVELIERGSPTMNNHLEFQRLNVDAGRTVANLMDRQLGNFV